jgi:hypothetical protein
MLSTPDSPAPSINGQAVPWYRRVPMMTFTMVAPAFFPSPFLPLAEPGSSDDPLSLEATSLAVEEAGRP